MISRIPLSILAMTLTLPACAVSSSAAEETHDEAVGETDQALSLGPESTPRLDALGTPPLDDLQRLYESGTTLGGMPEGRAVGHAYFLGLPGFTALEEHLREAGWLAPSRVAEDLVANSIWHGKTFRAAPSADGTRIGTLTNDVLGFPLASADIRLITSSDDRDESGTIYLDYSRSDFAVVRGVQDYIRRIDDGLYIGKAFITLPGMKTRALACYFALDFAR